MANRRVSEDAGGALSGQHLEVQDHVTSGRHTLVLSGELDMANAAMLETMIERLCTEGIAGIALDLTALTFIDSTGIRVVVSAQQLCKEHGYAFALTPGTPAVQRIFEISGLLDTLPFQDAA